jgi:tetratricopeptide (TPR) repeat protein
MIRFLKILCMFLVSCAAYSQDASYYLLRGRAMIDAGKFSEAVAVLSEAIEKNPDGRLFEMRGEAFLKSKDYAKSLADYKNANTYIAGIGEYGMSELFAIKGDVAASLAHLEMNINSPFRKSEKEIMLNPVFSLIDRTPDWRQFWKEDRYEIPDTRIHEIEYYLSTNNMEEATNVVNSLEADYPGNNSTMYAKALVDFSNQKYADVIGLISRLMNSDKKNEKYLRLLALAQYESGNASGASNSYSQLIGLGIIDADLYLKRAECYLKTGENSRALSDVSMYLELYPDSKEALRLAGKIEVQSGDNLKAIDYYSRNLKAHPDDPLCYIDRANSYFLSKSWEYAINDYSMALDIDPSNSEVWLNKGTALLNTGRVEDACFDLRRSHSLGNRKAAQLISKNCIK